MNRLRAYLQPLVDDGIIQSEVRDEILDIVDGKLYGIPPIKQYQLGDKWSLDFDYEGMLRYATDIGTKKHPEINDLSYDVDKLETLLESMEDVNYHSEAELLYDVIETSKWIKEHGRTEETRKELVRKIKLFRFEVKQTLSNLVFNK